MIEQVKSNFPVRDNAIFMAHCAISPLYHRACEAIKTFADDLASGGISKLPKYFNEMDRFHKNIGDFLHVSPKDISYIHNTAEALCMIGNGYPFETGDNVVSYIHEYPSNHYPWRLQQARGVDLKLVPDFCEEDKNGMGLPVAWSMEGLEQTVTPCTRMVAISHVQFTSGYGSDLLELGEFCRMRDIDLVVDCAQSLGCLPVYPEKYNISAMVSSGWKWLFGPKGSALLYTSPRFREKLNITMAGPGLMHQGLEYLNHEWQPHDDGRMFEYSTLPWDHIAGMNLLFEDIFLQLSMEDIWKEVVRLQDILLDHLDPDLMRFVLFQERNRSGILAAKPFGDHRTIVAELAKQKVIVTAPVGYLRFAPHFYLRDEQMIEAASIINQVCHSKM